MGVNANVTPGAAYQATYGTTQMGAAMPGTSGTVLPTGQISSATAGQAQAAAATPSAATQQAATPVLNTSGTANPGSASPNSASVTQQISQALAPGNTAAPLTSAQMDPSSALAEANSAGGIQQALPVAQNLVQTGSLGRIDASQINTAPSAAMQSVLQQEAANTNGYTPQALQQMTDQQTMIQNQQTQQSSRALQDAQNNSGVRGATAANQQMQVQLQGMQANANVAQNVFLQNQQQKLTNLNTYSASVQAADAQTYAKQTAGIQLQQFNLAQAAKEQSAQLSTAMSIAGMGASAVSAANAASAAVAAGNAGASSSGSGGLFF